MMALIAKLFEAIIIFLSTLYLIDYETDKDFDLPHKELTWQEFKKRVTIRRRRKK